MPEPYHPKRRYYYIPQGLQQRIATPPIEKAEGLDADEYEKDQDGQGEGRHGFLEDNILHLYDEGLAHEAEGPDCEQDYGHL